MDVGLKRWTLSLRTNILEIVSILVLVDVGLKLNFQKKKSDFKYEVSILVLVDVGLKLCFFFLISGKPL